MAAQDAFVLFFGRRAPQERKNAVSPFATMCTALAATVGTGNIAGVATALTIGGPGAVFWMWVSAFFGMMTAFAENTLGMLYREKGPDGAWRGGPMLYLKKGLHSPFLAGAFALFCVLASFGMGNMSQCNSIAAGLSGVFGAPESVTGLVTAVLLGAVMLGGLARISRVTETLVPFMALFYMGGALAVLWCRRAYLPQACGQILAAAFDWQAGAGGLAGYGMARAIRTGVSRGVFSNEAGLGSSVMVHTAADAKEPCEQGMWAVFEVFFDTIVMCTVTALVILTSGVYSQTLYGLAAGTPLMEKLATGAQLTAAAFFDHRAARRRVCRGVARVVRVFHPARLVILRPAGGGVPARRARRAGLQGAVCRRGRGRLHHAAGSGVGALGYLQRPDGAAQPGGRARAAPRGAARMASLPPGESYLTIPPIFAPSCHTVCTNFCFPLSKTAFDLVKPPKYI